MILTTEEIRREDFRSFYVGLLGVQEEVRWLHYVTVAPLTAGVCSKVPSEGLKLEITLHIHCFFLCVHTYGEV